MAASYNLELMGPAPGPSTVGSDLWIDMGLIPTGKRIVFGVVYWTCTKTTTFELRTNLATKSAGTLVDTLLLSSASTSTKAPTKTLSFAKSRTAVQTVIGTGVEHWWLHLVSKSGTATPYNYDIWYLEQ